MSFKLVFEFETIAELMDHVGHLANLEVMNNLVNKVEPKPEDNRGSHIKELHIKAKAYHLEHPEIKYHQCMRLISKKTDELPI